MTVQAYSRDIFPIGSPSGRRAAVLAFSIFAAAMPGAGPALADGMYLGAGAGLNLARDADITGSGVDAAAGFDHGPLAVMSAGYGFDNGLRGELELAGRWNDVSSVGGSAGSGDTTTISGMMNVLYDFKSDNSITPYVGVGFGAARVEDSGVSPVNGSSISDADTVFAYQALAGASYGLNGMWDLTADYRYFASDDVSLATASGTSVEQEYASHSLLVGIRLNLGGGSSPMPQPASDAAPAPEPAAAAASDLAQVAEAPASPGLPRSYRILFDWDKKALNPLALNTIADIAMNISEGEIIEIRATGHADRSGSEAYNETLSRARAEEVRKALVGLGIPEDRIAIDWRGENDPAVPTADGVREQQNRRVEIVLTGN